MLAPPLPPAPAATREPAASDALAPLVGRESELALLDRFLAGEGGPAAAARVLLLAGEPGMGKTRLLQAAAQQAIAHGWCVLVGGCQRRGGEDPYAPLLAALARQIGLRPPEQLDAALPGCAWLVRLLPELTDVLEPLPAAAIVPEQERRLIHAAVARLLTNVAGPAGTLLILDDLQWAGPDALDLVNTLARTSGMLRIVGAYRDTEVRPADPLGVLLADLAQARLVRQHSLGPLTAAAAAGLLDDLLVDVAEADRGRVEGVLQRAGGTPFFLVSYAQAVRQGSVEGVPWDLAQGVLQRVAMLPAAGQAVLRAAAVVGRRASRVLLAAVVGQQEEAMLVGLEAACEARLLMEEGDDAYAFAHDLIREVVEAELGAARRAMLHRRVAEAMEGDPGGAAPELLAFHYDRGGTWDKAVRYLELAGDHAWGQRAHGAAEGHYREALARLDSLGRVQDAVRVREKLGEVFRRIGRYEAAIGMLEQAAASYGVAGDLEGLVRVTTAMGGAHSARGTTLRGIALITPLLERLERSGASPPSLAPLYEALGHLLFTAGRYDAALAAGERAAGLARACGDDRTLALAQEHQINSLQVLGRLGEALRLGQEVLPLAERVGDLECLSRAHSNLAFIHVLRADFASGRSSVDLARAQAEQLGNPGRLAFALALRSWLAVLSGDWTSARADLDQATAVGSQADLAWFSAYLPIFLARLSLAEGAWDAAAAQAQDALALSEGSGDLQGLRWASGVLAELDILKGRAEAARARLVPLLDRPGLEECDVTSLLPVLAWAHLELGQVDEAAETVEHSLRRARPEAMRLVLVEALRVQALIALRRERWEEATRSLEEGLELARGMPYPYAEARLLQVSSELHAQRGAQEAARDQLEAARAIFARLGARLDLARVAQTLETLSQNYGPGQSETVVSDAQWALVQAVLPPPARMGRRRADGRRTLEAILYQRRTGCAWAALPAVFGDEATAHRRWREWQGAGLWERIAAIMGTVPAPPEEPSGPQARGLTACTAAPLQHPAGRRDY